MKQKHVTRDDRLDLRISAEIKALVARAAAVSGTTMSAFMIEAARERATRLIEQQERLVLNNESRDLLLNTLTNPPVPSAQLRRAAEKFGTEDIN